MISRYLYGQFMEHLGRDIYDGIWVGKDFNTFDSPRNVRPEPFADFIADGDTLTFTLPAKTIVMMALDPQPE